jgi:hypothetical protein
MIDVIDTENIIGYITAGNHYLDHSSVSIYMLLQILLHQRPLKMIQKDDLSRNGVNQPILHKSVMK